MDIKELINECCTYDFLKPKFNTGILYSEEVQNGKFTCRLYLAKEPEKVIITSVPNVNEQTRDKARMQIIRSAFQLALPNIILHETVNNGK